MNAILAQLKEKVTASVGAPTAVKTWNDSARLEYDNDIVVELDIYKDFYEVRITRGLQDIAWGEDIDEALECLTSYAAA